MVQKRDPESDPSLTHSRGGLRSAAPTTWSLGEPCHHRPGSSSTHSCPFPGHRNGPHTYRMPGDHLPKLNCINPLTQQKITWEFALQILASQYGQPTCPENRAPLHARAGTSLLSSSVRGSAVHASHCPAGSEMMPRQTAAIMGTDRD